MVYCQQDIKASLSTMDACYPGAAFHVARERNLIVVYIWYYPPRLGQSTLGIRRFSFLTIESAIKHFQHDPQIANVLLELI
jgi:hypothetical protein